MTLRDWASFTMRSLHLTPFLKHSYQRIIFLGLLWEWCGKSCSFRNELVQYLTVLFLIDFILRTVDGKSEANVSGDPKLLKNRNLCFSRSHFTLLMHNWRFTSSVCSFFFAYLGLKIWLEMPQLSRCVNIFHSPINTVLDEASAAKGFSPPLLISHAITLSWGCLFLHWVLRFGFWGRSRSAPFLKKDKDGTGMQNVSGTKQVPQNCLDTFTDFQTPAPN